MRATDVRKSLWVGFGALLALMLVLGAVGMRSSLGLARDIEHAVRASLDPATDAAALTRDVATLASLFARRAEPSDLDRGEADIAKALLRLDQRTSSLGARTLDPASREAFERWQRAERSYGIDARRALATPGARPSEALSDALVSSVTALGAVIDAHAEAAKADLLAKSGGGRAGKAAILAVIFALGLGLARFTHRSITREMDKVVGMNERLAAMVAERTRTLQLVLDSTGDGLFTVALDGAVCGVRTRATEAWLGAICEGLPAARYLFPDDPRASGGFELAFEQLAADVFPFETAADMLPTRLSRGDRHFTLTYKPVRENDALTGVLVQLSDVTARLASERAEREALERQQLLTHFARDPDGFRAGIADCARLVDEISAETRGPLLLRQLHTLKGASATLGFARVADECHALEDALAGEAPAMLTADDLERLRTTFGACVASVRDVVEADASLRGGLRISEAEHAALLQRLRARPDLAELAATVARWSWPRVSERLERLRAQAERTAARLGKAVTVIVDDDGSRMSSERLASFWPSLVHVLRNAIDHGIEPREARRARGKAELATLRIGFAQANDGSCTVEIGDDGPGIDFEALAAAATRRGLTVSAATPLEDLVFSDGVSTREEVSEISGRGVGMAAVREACEREGGTVSIETARGVGTRVRFRFPAPARTWARAS
jgi:HPt (histidine-containing phosphotransfer) domain-containing protein